MEEETAERGDPAPSSRAHAAPDALDAYRHLRDQGASHEAVVRMLARHVLEVLAREREERALRGGPRA